ncbi:MAG: hypothetical protein LBQ37_04580, partial [Elusimicrobiota bacterium]|nr:hypothetical protein [Elusimicrobiota bacterium]
RTIWSDISYAQNKGLEVKGFAGINGGVSQNDEIRETGDLVMKIEAGYYAKLSGLFGLRADWVSDKLDWFGKIYLGGIEYGKDVEYDMSLEGQKMSKIEGSIHHSAYAGFGGGIEYKLTTKTALTLNTSIKAGADIFEYFGGAGVRVGF